MSCTWEWIPGAGTYRVSSHLKAGGVSLLFLLCFLDYSSLSCNYLHLKDMPTDFCKISLRKGIGFVLDVYHGGGVEMQATVIRCLGQD